MRNESQYGRTTMKIDTQICKRVRREEMSRDEKRSEQHVGNVCVLNRAIHFIHTIAAYFCEFPLKSIYLEKLSNAMNFPFIY